MLVIAIAFTWALLAPSAECRASAACERVKDIKVLPFKHEHVDDPAYNELLRNQRAVLPCLVDKLSDATLMADPRKAPTYNGVTVGDVAYFVLIRFTGEPFEKFLPPEVQESYRRDGVDAYFRYVEQPDARVAIQMEWRAWLQAHGTE